ncbi:M1 family metallopeptidase [Streptomyces sp. H10-C2]|uniref:M1 family metallopeptidase n=1 Tax=unclassified Streptomyces TaxID=2593676 RepID=UPI0024B948E2|nr:MULTISPECIES: M1 family metallopeptidase [unclassified Streptomyces]MDJ0339978.1 M1 family metallopeptidase [Streptomyces sp. PH10-H1]MDJ0369385.1 M1 family metallopeptidase [Streptomyces sp. H10-C2]
MSAAGLLLAIPASAADAGPGAPGIGDPYYPSYGNGGYDVSHYDLRLKYQPATDHLDGTATISATATQGLTRFDLDFALDVSDIQVNGRTAQFAFSGEQELVVTPARPIAKGQQITVVVRYSGVPSTVKRYGFTSWQRTPDGGVGANEPESAWWWFPSNDHPLDKATYDVSVLVPDGTQAISNGVLVSQSSKLGWTRYNWRENKPQATYLATLAVGKFDITTDTTANGLPVINAYSKDLGDNGPAARASVERTGEITDWLSGYFGPYPFSAVGGYVPNVPTHFALETQTRVFYSPAQFARGSNASVVVHELAHQWYGDSVSLERWSDIWLNEGFASYAQWLWSEHEGEGTAQELADWVYSQHPAADPFWTVKPGDPGADKQFDAAVYDRGALTLQAIRNTIGDTAFFALLKAWPAQHQYGNGNIAEFQQLAEKISGKKLGPLFQTWLFTAAKPATPAVTGPAAKALRAAPAASQAEPKSWKQIQATHDIHHR